MSIIAFIFAIITSASGSFFYENGNIAAAINAWVVTFVIIFDQLIHSIKGKK